MNIQRVTVLRVMTGFVVFMSFFWGLGKSPLFDEDEGFFAEGTREMMQSRDYITPRVMGEARFDKPVFTNWLQVGSMKLFGKTEFAIRLPSAMASMLWMILIYFFVLSKYDDETACLSTLMITAAIQVTTIGRAALSDALLNCFVTGAMIYLFNYIENSQKRDLYIFYLFAGFGFATKGPIAIAIPVIVLLICMTRWKKWRLLPSFISAGGILIFAVVGLPWYFLQYHKMGNEFLYGFFFHHNLQRFSQSFEGHGGPVYYYLPVLLLGTLPFTVLIINGLVTQIRKLKDPLTFFLFSWFCFVFIFFSFSGTKLPHYIIAGYTPLFILAAMRKKPHRTRSLFLPFITLWLILFIAPMFSQQALTLTHDSFAHAIILNIPVYFNLPYFIIMLALMVVIMGLGIWGRNLNEIIRLGFLSILFLIMINQVFMPILWKLIQEPVKEAALLARQNQYKVITMDHYYPSFNFYASQLTPIREPQKGEVVFSRIDNLQHYANLDTLYYKNGFILAKLSGNKNMNQSNQILPEAIK